MSYMTIELDERDSATLARRVALYDVKEGPRVGDYVDFADGVVRRISHHWYWPADSDGPEVDDFQTSDLSGAHGWYFGEGYMSFSGGLYHAVSRETLTDTGETRMAGVWFFHHEFAGAGNGIETQAPFRVFRCSLNATT